MRSEDREQLSLLDAINRVFRETLTCETEEQLVRTCLAVAEDLTDSACGFLGEMNDQGLMDTIAVSASGWELCRMPDSDAARMIRGMEPRGLFGATIRGGRSTIVSDPRSDPDSVGVPRGHVRIDSFLGVPLLQEGKVQGMIGLANKASGYEPGDQAAVERLATAIVEALQRKRAQIRLAEAERRNERLTRILLAIRNVNQLIVREKDPQALIGRACQLIVEQAAFRAAWLVRVDEGLRPTGSAEDGFGERFTPLARQLRQGQLPPCCRLGMDAGGRVHIGANSGACHECPLWREDRPDGRFLVCLEHEGRTHGFLCVAAPAGELDDEEQSLLQEMADDLAFAMHNIRLENDRRRMTAELGAEKERYQSLVESVPGMVYRARPDWTTEMVNDSLEICGYSRAELDSPETSWFTLIHPDDRERVVSEAAGIEDSPTKLVQEYRIVARDGRTVWIEDRKSSRHTDDGSFCGVDGIVLDVTERRELQTRLAQADRLASVGMLAAGVAHEINNPLTYVLYHLESMTEDLPALASHLHDTAPARRRSPASDDQDAIEALRSVQADLRDLASRATEALEGSHRIKSIVQDLKTFSRVESENVGPVSLNRVADQAIDMAFNQIKFRARLVKEFGEIPPVLAVEGRLAQVFLNLLVNAAQAIDEGVPDLNEIRVRTWCEGEAVLAEISDTGEGIPEERLAHVFEPFYSTKEGSHGAGMGLPMCRAILARFGGDIEVWSTEGEGTRFRLRMPMDARAAARRDTEVLRPSRPESKKARGRILVIDDEPAICSALRRVLNDHEVVATTSAQEGQQILRRGRDFDLILCDLMMPDVSGMDLYDWLAERDASLAERMVFISGGVFTPRARTFLQQVDNARLEKPFDRSELLQLVQALLATWRRRSRGRTEPPGA